jgi:hypothetical protein
MVKVLSQAFGGGSGKEEGVVKVNEMRSASEAASALNNFFGVAS